MGSPKNPQPTTSTNNQAIASSSRPNQQPQRSLVVASGVRPRVTGNTPFVETGAANGGARSVVSDLARGRVTRTRTQARGGIGPPRDSKISIFRGRQTAGITRRFQNSARVRPQANIVYPAGDIKRGIASTGTAASASVSAVSSETVGHRQSDLRQRSLPEVTRRISLRTRPPIDTRTQGSPSAGTSRDGPTRATRDEGNGHEIRRQIT